MNHKIKKFLKPGLIISFSMVTFSCNSFNKLSRENEHINQEEFLIVNKKAGFQSVFFADFLFAENMKGFKKLNPASPPAFNNIVLYGKTKVKPFYEIYIIEGKAEASEYFLIKENSFKNKTFSFIISKNAPQYDIDFLMQHFEDYFDE